MTLLKFSSGSIKFFLEEEEIFASRKFLCSKGLDYFPDGTLGILKNGRDVVIFASNNAIARLKGQFDSPFEKIDPGVTLEQPKQPYDYVGGGPIYFDKQFNILILSYHAEDRTRGLKKFFSRLGLAYSQNKGQHFRDAGKYITIQKGITRKGIENIEISGGALVPGRKYLYVYYTDYTKMGKRRLAVARAPINKTIAAAQKGEISQFRKYYKGKFSEPGLGGKFTSLIRSQKLSWPHVIYNEYLKKFTLVYTISQQLFLSFSSDGINWENPVPIITTKKNSKEEFFYPTLLSLRDDPVFAAGKEFWIYYTRSQIGAWNRWKDAQWVRRKIILE